MQCRKQYPTVSNKTWNVFHQSNTTNLPIATKLQVSPNKHQHAKPSAKKQKKITQDVIDKFVYLLVANDSIDALCYSLALCNSLKIAMTPKYAYVVAKISNFLNS